MAFDCTFPLSEGCALVGHPSAVNRKPWTTYEVRSPYTGNQWTSPQRWAFDVELDAATNSMKGKLLLVPDANDPDDAEIKRAFAESQKITLRIRFGNGKPANLTVYLKP